MSQAASKQTLSDNIRVAVRVRPFNEREHGRNAQLIVTMEQATTLLLNPANLLDNPRKFVYDYSYWSHDGYQVRDDGYYEPTQSTYADQEVVFNDLGRDLLENAWMGYNCSIFAYGQTGSGKSYSIMGHGTNKGIVPRTCEELFQEIDKKKNKDIVCEVTFSMLEIYNEQTHDLLSKNIKRHQHGLNVREHPDKGFYVEALTTVAVGSFNEIRQRIDEGNKQRTIAATKMNETSSRAHTIVTINFTQNDKKQKISKQSSINLVDLAGSERQKQTESSGDRFKEATNINQSLSTLGNVIHALAENAKQKYASKTVPYRDSILTKLLKNALGGNSKTFMIAAISPDAENYDQTLSTLKYADRVKEIRTDARVNQVDTNKMIQSLIAEKEKLLKDLESAKTGAFGYMTVEEIQKLKDEQQVELLQYKEQMKDMEKAWEKRLADARRELEERSKMELDELEAEKRTPHLSNLNEDPALTGKLRYICKPGSSSIGNGKDTESNIVLHGPRIVSRHAEIVNAGGQLMLVPLKGSVLHNGTEITSQVTLTHGDRVRFGSNHLYIFHNPEEERGFRKKRKLREFTYEDAQEEIVKNSGLDLTHKDHLLRDEVMNIMPIVESVNAMAEEMDKPSEFTLLLVSPEARGLETGRTEVYVKVLDQSNGNIYLWDKNKFLIRQAHMQEMYQQFEDLGTVDDVPQDKDPFWEPADMEVIVGVALLPLSYLSYMIPFQEEDPISIIDYMANSCGYLKLELVPCDPSGRERHDLNVNEPVDLVDKPASFKIKICQAMNLPSRFIRTWCQYKFYSRLDYSKTSIKDGQNPTYNHEEVITLKKLDYKLVDYLKEKSITIEIWGKQSSKEKKIMHKPRLDEKMRVTELQERITKLENKLMKVKDLTERMPKTVTQRAEILRILQQ